MKITCPKCLAAYRVDLPDSDEAGIDVQCGKCLSIFLFSPHIEKTEPSRTQKGPISKKGRDSDLSKNRPSEPILPPQKGEDQEVSGAQKQTSSSLEDDLEAIGELEMETHSDNPEAIEIVIEDEVPDDSLEKEALDDIWDQAMQEGARTVEKPPSQPVEKPVTESIDERTPEETPLLPDEKANPVPSLEDRQRAVDQIVKDHQAKQRGFEDPQLAHKTPQQEKIQEEIDLNEEVIIDEEEAIPSWEEAFAHQAEIEAGWNKAQEQDRLQEEQQLAEALGEQAEPTSKEATTEASQENKQDIVDEIFAELKDSQKPPKETTKAPKPEADPKQDEVDQIFAEAKARQEKIQEEIDLNEEVVIDEEEAMPSWEDAFAHQAKVEEGWNKSKEQDRIQEEQQLAEALGEEYTPTEPAVSETPAVAENPQTVVDDIFAQLKSQAEATDQPPAQETPASSTTDTGTTTDKVYEPTWTDAFADQSKIEETWEKFEEPEDPSEVSATSEEKKTTPFDSPIPDGIDLTEDLVNMDMKQLVEQAFKEEAEQSEEIQIPEEVEPPALEEVTAEPDLALEMETETPEPDLTAPVSQDVEDISETIDYYANYVDPPATPETETIPELTLESADEEPAQEPVEPVAQEEESEEEEAVWTDAFADLSETQGISEELEPEEPEIVEAVAQEEEAEIELESEPTLESAEMPMEAEIPGEESLEIEPEPALESSEIQAESESETVEAVAQEEEVEIETEPEPTLESAEMLIEEEIPGEESLEIEPEPALESSEIQAEEEMTSTEPLEVEQESELTPEPAEAEFETVEAVAQEEEAQIELEPEPTLDKESEELWAELLPEHKEEEQLVQGEASVAFTDEEEEDAFGGSDFWDQVLEKEPEESQTAETETEPQPASPAPVAQDEVPATQSAAEEREALTDEELWQQAFPDEEELEPTTSKSLGEESPQTTIPPLVVGANVGVNLNEEENPEDSLKYDEAAYADYDDDDDDEFEFQRKKRNLGPFTIPHGRRGDLVIGGAMLVFLLIAGSVYFTLQTFAPGELTDIQTAENEVPEGLTPREVPLDELVSDLTTPKPPKPEQTPVLDTPGDKGESILSDPAKILEESPEEKGILKDLAESQILKDTGETQTAKVDQSNLQALTGHSVTMSTIMPVAYNPTDIRVLSFSVKIQLSNAQSAKMVRESMPVYEEIMNQTVEDLLRRKFYNDVLYVKEKLQKRLQTAMNKSLKNGRVRKAKFVDFAIQ
jgi:predicted Zn finger-like uncharacterized protein